MNIQIQIQGAADGVVASHLADEQEDVVEAATKVVEGVKKDGVPGGTGKDVVEWFPRDDKVRS